jgi:antitoxin component YwqK of YwqJK toxin-antitoxin module
MNEYNDKGERHGYWEIYHNKGKLSHKGNYINGKKDGYWESYWLNGNLNYKKFYL